VGRERIIFIMPKLNEKAKLEGLEDGMPIYCTLHYNDGEMQYRLMCPRCKGHNFVPSIDRDRVVCTSVNCLSTIFTRVDGVRADPSGVEWKI